jgi:NAD(P)-dependent dehydrogenase (short-subunit alcohol dehydrogenase family)
MSRGRSKSGSVFLARNSLFLAHHAAIAAEPQDLDLIVEIPGAPVPAVVRLAVPGERGVGADGPGLPALLDPCGQFVAAIGAHYNAAKAGLEGLTRGYAARLVKEGITVNGVAPSLIETDMIRARREEMAARIPLGRMGKPEEVAQAVLMLIGNPYRTGQTIQLNGDTNFI